DPDVGYDDWLRCGMAIYSATRGSTKGLDLLDSWSSRGKKYRGRKEIEAKWRSFKLDRADQVTIGTLINMVTQQGDDWMEVCTACEPDFGPSETVTVPCNVQRAAEPPTTAPAERKTSLDKYSLRGHAEEIERLSIEEKPLL